MTPDPQKIILLIDIVLRTFFNAIKLAIARALCKIDSEHKSALKSHGLLTRDARVVERKKPGQKKARKQFQWVKR